MDIPDVPLDLDQRDEPSGHEIIVRADEVDEAGADISTITTTNDEDLEARVEARRLHDIQATASPKVLANQVPSLPKPPIRPILRKKDSVPPPPPQQPPPPAPPQQDDALNGTDSLNLAQLRHIVRDLPRLEPVAYAYTYEDTRTFPEELEEWFQYTEEDRGLLSRAQEAYEDEFNAFEHGKGKSLVISADEQGVQWLKLPPEAREQFALHEIQQLKSENPLTAIKNLECMVYIALGVWHETAGLREVPLPQDEREYEAPNEKYRNAIGQLKCIQDSAKLLCSIGAIYILYDAMRMICDNDQPYSPANDMFTPETEEEAASMRAFKDRQLGAITTILYFVVESGRREVERDNNDSIRQHIVALEPKLLHYLSQLVAKLRWEDSSNIPLTKALLLLWKSILLIFGGSRQLHQAKGLLDNSNETGNDQAGGFLTASPLDYHIFRQEITSKYPAYNPPPPLVPLEPNNNSFLPPLPSHPSRNCSQDNMHSIPGAVANGGGKSIFHQPVHISTPAPSPPPSPVGPGGKGGKKQNYQTNQNFPFLYPPLDGTSNDVGGKGNAGMQDRLVGKRWEGSDVPASILEAGELFASRMRMSRSLRKMWEVREEFIKFERGWEGSGNIADCSGEGLNEDLDNLNLEPNDEGGEEKEDGDEEETAKDKSRKRDTSDPLEAEEPARETVDDDLQGRLDAIEKYYRHSLPHLQSIVIVLLKVILSNITALGTQPNSQPGFPDTLLFPEGESNDRMPKRNLNLVKHLNGAMNGFHNEGGDSVDPALEELNATRLREVTSKAVTGILLMLLKWFKLSHVLKFEYMTQLLLDSNYLPLALKFFALQDVDRSTDHRNDREDLDFFRLCQVDAGHAPTLSQPIIDTPESSSDDEAQPPPILAYRRTPADSSPPAPSSASVSSDTNPDNDEFHDPPATSPNVGHPYELGQPFNIPQPTPLTTYAPRFFHVTITLLRLLQKLIKNHAHRALLLVQYKSSTILRRALKIPQPDLRLYTLKLFKAQTPYCGRKWRQTNMRVITAIYLHCRMELRDEWIAGGTVEESVEEAVPLEQAGRALVHWWHLRKYREAMGIVGESVEGGDFFRRELERMGWGVTASVEGEDEEWEGGPLMGEGW